MPATVVRDTFRAPFETVPGGRDLLVICDHASNALPEEYGRLGLPEVEFGRHIAYDIGAAGVARRLAGNLNATAILSGFSRLLIDPNRGEDDPTLVMRLSDGAVIPANARVAPEEIARRVRRFHRPYHEAIAGWIDESLAGGSVPAIVSVHSYTPRWKTAERRWHAALLWDRDPRLARPLIEGLEAEGFVIGDNEPYGGALEGDTLYVHGTGRGLPHALIEVRQDLISDQAGQTEWAERLARVLRPLLERAENRRIELYGSRAGGGRRRQAPDAET